MSPDQRRIEELERKLNERTKEVEQLQANASYLERENLKLKEENQQYKGVIFSSASLITYLKGPEYIIEFANEPIRNVWGKGDQVVGKPLFEVIPEVREQGIEDYLNQAFYKGEPFHAQSLPVEHNVNGELIKSYFDFSYMPQRNDDGEILGIGVIALDVTSQALLHEKIRNSERQFRELVNFMPHKITVVNSEGKGIFCNQNWLDYTGKSFMEFIGQTDFEMFHPDDRKKVSSEAKNCFFKGEILDIEARIEDKNGDYKWHLIKATPIKDGEEQVTSWITSSTEIQKIKEDEKRKEDFLKLVSHELKTPVTSIKGYVQLLLATLSKKANEENNPLPVKTYLHRMENQVERLIRLISEMLDLSRIEQNELELRYEKFNLNKHVEEIVQDLTCSSINLDLKLSHDFNCEVYADKDRIGQVIINFVNNALKYSPDSNKVEISVYDHKDGQVAISVKDFGIGIAKKEQDQIFKKFYRISGNKDDTYAGFGIGLYLSNEIIERHQGKIYVKSEKGKGSKFTFTLPINQN
ncbi:ATP-binding protein [Gramella lutea]|uniref:histidine kinase n=1 Tax=Christiangramia lutea TaxID=1607951 RepID=A0A9X1V3T5_9FLAO|nr:ATP-binding protein [Christiangramia lutea]MCH4823146.1 ATP-binding protein [Christiangramia lutea]